MTEVPEAFGKPKAPPPGPRGDAESRADVPRDYKDRYAICDEFGGPPPTLKNGNPIGRTRASTVKNGATDKTGIINWSKMVVTKGLALDPGLLERAMKAATAEDVKALYAIADEAFTKGGGKESAERGSAFHEVTELIKRGDQVSPDDLDKRLVKRDVDAYLQALAEHNLRPVPGMQERVVILPNGAAGTFDDLFQYWNPDTEEWELIVGDTKSGKEIWKYGALEIQVQLWQYANALALWIGPKQGSTKEYGEPAPMPEDLRKDRAVVVHSRLDGTCEVSIIDISGIGAVVDAIMTIRRARAEAMQRVHHIGKVDLREPSYVASADLQSVTPAGQPALQNVEMVSGPYLPVRTPGATLAADDWGGPTPTAPTPDAAEQERKRIERLAVLDGMAAKLGRNDDPDDGEPQLDGEGKPLAPFKQPGQRGCGVCGRTGHKSTSKRCLGENDPGKAPAVAAPKIIAATVYSEPVGGERLGPEESAQLIEAATAQVVNPRLAEQSGQYCPGTCNAGWTADPNRPGLFVCGNDGLPTILHLTGWLERQAEAEKAIDPEAAALLAGCKSAGDVMAAVQLLQAKRLWNEEIDAAAKQRWHEVQFAGWPNTAP
jgi:hypothetical protein